MHHAGIGTPHPRRAGVAEHDRISLEINLPEIRKFRVSALHDKPVGMPEVQRSGDGLEVASVFRDADLPPGLFRIAANAREPVSPKAPRVQEEKNGPRSHLVLATDDRVDPITIGGGTYAREMKNAVAFGPMKPGKVDCCHISNEYFEMDDFIDSIKVYYLAIKELSR